MAGVPINFSVPGEGAIATYSYTDISEGTGVVVFNGASINNNGTITYILTTDTPFSDLPLTQGITALGTSTKLLDLDFDATFNSPRNLKGLCKANVPFIAGLEATANYTGNYWIVFKVRKWDGSTETEIANNTSSRVCNVPTSSEANSFNVFTSANVTSVVHFKKGETLRLTLELWCGANGGNGSVGAILHDPAARTMTRTDDFGGIYETTGDVISPTISTTKLTFYIPFLLDL